jgi:glycosyltransferase involved in cell wall biosynthesis
MNLGRKILFMLFRLIARFRLSRMGAIVLVLTSRPLALERNASKIQKRYRALVMQRTGFLQDVEESFREGGDFEVIYWSSFALKAFGQEILAASLDHNNYISSDPKVEATKMEYRQFLADVWRYFSAMKPVDIVLTGNFAYFTEREFAVALEQAGTPFIALHKENVRPPRRVQEYWFTLYKDRRGKFGGRRILVYNDIERDLEIAAGVIDAQDVLVTGMPRLDRLHRWRRDHAGRPNQEKPQILFFAFARSDKLTAIQRKASAGVPGDMEAMEGGWGKLSWGQYCVDTHKAIIDLARENPAFEVIVKSKGQKRKLNDILRILSDMRDGLPPNVTVITSGDPFDLIASCQVVVGFNTTGLLEAIATGKPVIVPRFAEASDPAMQDLIIDLGDAVEYAESPEALKSMISGYVKHPRELPAQLPSEASRVLRYWVGNDDGLAGHRVIEILRAEIESARAARPV